MAMLTSAVSNWLASAQMKQGCSGTSAMTLMRAPVIVKSSGPKVEGLVGADNFGARSAGQNRVFAAANWNNPTGRGDVLSVRVQAADRKDSELFRLAYSTTLTSAATKVGVSAMRTEYSLGKQFEALGATPSVG